MRKVRVLFVSNSGSGYGAQKNLLDILGHLDSQRYEAYLACPAEGPLQEEAKKLGIHTFNCPWGSWLRFRLLSTQGLRHAMRSLWGVVRLVALIRRLRIDIVYSNNGYTLCGAVASRLTRTPHVWHIQERIGHRRLPCQLIDRLSSHIVVISEFIKNTLPENLRPRARLVYNGFPTSAALLDKPQRTVLRKRYGIVEDDVILSIVGGIEERKGQRELLCAMPLVRTICPRAKLIIAGDTSGGRARPYEQAVRDLVRMYRLEDIVQFIGYQKEVSEIYRLTDILVVPSRQEPFGRVVVEGMLFEVPIIATRDGGIPEIVGNSPTAVLLDSLRPEDIANAVSTVLAARGQLDNALREARISAAERFGMEAMIKQIEGILREAALAHKRTRNARPG